MLGRKGYRSLDKLLSLVVTFIDQSKACEKMTSMKTVHTRYSEVAADVTRDMRQLVKTRMI